MDPTGFIRADFSKSARFPGNSNAREGERVSFVHGFVNAGGSFGEHAIFSPAQLMSVPVLSGIDPG